MHCTDLLVEYAVVVVPASTQIEPGSSAEQTHVPVHELPWQRMHALPLLLLS